MTQIHFQAALARLVLDRSFRDLVRRGGAAAITADLTELERQRLVAVASSRGIEVTRTLYLGWRLTKVLSLLPLTSALLGDRRLADELGTFWDQCPPRTFYFVEESLAFCNHLRARLEDELRVQYLDEVLAYEQAKLELRRDRALGAPATPRAVRFDHEPHRLLVPLAAGRRPHSVRRGSYLLVGALDATGVEHWEVLDGSIEPNVRILHSKRKRLGGRETDVEGAEHSRAFEARPRQSARRTRSR